MILTTTTSTTTTTTTTTSTNSNKSNITSPTSITSHNNSNKFTYHNSQNHYANNHHLHHHHHQLIRKTQSTPKLRSSSSITTLIPLKKKKKECQQVSTTQDFSSSSTTPSATSHFNFFKKISTEWNLFINKIKNLSDEVFNIDDIIDDLFEDSEGEYYTSTDKEIDSNFPDYSNMKLKDIIRHHHFNKEIDTYDESDEEIDYDNEFNIDLNDKNLNVGNLLWEIRRKNWLKPNKSPEEVNERIRSGLITEYMPKDSYLKIYNYLIEKNKILKSDKHINLLDMMKIINYGWIAEDKWERAAKGLP
ncbi:unnamed protein product [Candida verbasci]|uniref:Gag1-like clamp domain-containing protein n=1 Tax=Candida verbasci TaxID=1227364 RepID=A0A9W4TT85_9ASCO|nr:unnamed protein product [Candida verbasci]